MLQYPFALVGRDPANDLLLEEPAISRRHAYLQLIGGRVFCIDLGSRTGLHWHGERHPTGWLDVGENVRLGTYSIRYVDESRSAPERRDDRSPLRFRSLDGQPLPDVVLEFLNATPRRTWEMNCVLALIGSSNDCRIRLKSGNIADRHCSLVRTPDGIWLVDLLAPGGVRVNGLPVTYTYLTNGDQIQVGLFTIRVWHNAVPIASRETPMNSAIASPPSQITFGSPGEEHILFDTDTRIDRVPSQATPPNGTLVAAPNSAVARAPVFDPEDLNEAVLQPLLHQFAEMQQQMSERYQQAMSSVLDMFTGVQRDELGIIRDEVDRLQELSEELQALQAELARRQASTGAVSTPPVATRADDILDCSTMAKDEVAAEAPAVPCEVADTEQREIVAGEDNGHDSAINPEENGVHLWLLERMAEVQKERETRLQKVLHFLRVR